eukprot:3713664-Amphidinium_carterae.1
MQSKTREHIDGHRFPGSVISTSVPNKESMNGAMLRQRPLLEGRLYRQVHHGQHATRQPVWDHTRAPPNEKLFAKMAQEMLNGLTSAV